MNKIQARIESGKPVKGMGLFVKVKPSGDGSRSGENSGRIYLPVVAQGLVTKDCGVYVRCKASIDSIGEMILTPCSLLDSAKDAEEAESKAEQQRQRNHLGWAFTRLRLHSRKIETVRAAYRGEKVLDGMVFPQSTIVQAREELAIKWKDISWLDKGRMDSSGASEAWIMLLDVEFKDTND